MKRLYMISAPIVFIIVWSSSSWAGDINIFEYAEPDNMVKEFTYVSTTSSGIELASNWQYSGRLIQTPVSASNQDGEDTLIVNNKYLDLPSFPTDYETRYIKRSDGYYTSNVDESGATTRHLILPIDSKVGSTWSKSSFWDTEEIEAMVHFNTPVDTFQNCLRIKRINGDRTELSKKVAERQLSISVICPKIGHVSTIITNTISAIQFETVTTLELIGVKKQ